jgi:hypothetical protein
MQKTHPGGNEYRMEQKYEIGKKTGSDEKGKALPEILMVKKNK